MSFTSTAWVWSPSEDTGGYPPITIERCRQLDGSIKYAVRQGGACMDGNGVWEYEPQPSSRDDEFLARFRFDKWDGAADAIIRHCTPVGRFVVQAAFMAGKYKT